MLRSDNGKMFWVEAANMAVYLLNLLPTKALNFHVPFEKWYYSKPTVEHLRIFGCVCYMHIPEDKETSLTRNLMLGSS